MKNKLRTIWAVLRGKAVIYRAEVHGTVATRRRVMIIESSVRTVRIRTRHVGQLTDRGVTAGAPGSDVIETPEGRHFRIPRGLPGLNGVENDEAFATYIAEEGKRYEGDR